MFQLASDLDASPRVGPDSDLPGEVMFSNRKVEKFDSRAPEFLQPPAENSRVEQRRTAIGAAPSRSIAGSPRPCRITGCSTRRYRKPPSSAPPWGMRSKAAAWLPS
jgi:hypothetical protein